MRRAHRLDGNHQEIASAFEALGCSVKSAAGLGDGFPDLIVARHKTTILVEIKQGDLSPSRRKLTDAEARFHSGWKGRIELCETVEDVERIVNSL